ncbi:MAG: NAD-dependent epimerase/dehydratase family protein [Bacteroidota bacterium]
MTDSVTLVTGATGLLGSAIIRTMHREGRPVIGFVQTGQDATPLQNLGVPFRTGDLLCREDIDNALKGVDVVIHTAALTDIWPGRNPALWKVNLEGTRNLVEAAEESKVKKMIYVGTANSFGFGSKDNPGDETRPYTAARYRVDYLDSKYATQRYILDKVKNSNFPAVVVNPTFMIGPCESQKGSIQMIRAVVSRKVPGYTRGGRNYIYVNDAVRGIINAVQKGRTGECYILGNKNLNYKEMFSLIAREAGVPAPRIPFPAPLALAYASLLSLLAFITGKAPAVSLGMARISKDGHYYSPRKAIEELELPQTPIEVAVREALSTVVSAKS